MSRKVVYKTYSQDQLSLLPPSYDDLVPSHHPVRIVNTIIDSLDISVLEKSYKGGGSSSYHPRMLLKVVVYAYLRNLYSSRKIEQALQENIHFMWLSGQSKPDHNTINNFRGKRLKHHFKKIFNQVVLLLHDQGYLSLKDLYVDGTRLEANASRYSFVWAKSIKTNRAKMLAGLKELWTYVEEVYQDEEQQPNTPDFEQIDSTKLQETIAKINEALSGKEVKKKVRSKLNYARKHWVINLKKYEDYEKQLGDRNSMSKTDPDASFMRMKDDHMNNGQLKPGYNLQVSSNNHFIVNYNLTQTTADTISLIPHLEIYKQGFSNHPLTQITADAGYGSEENYQYLQDNNTTAFVKYNYFHKELKEQKKGTQNPFAIDQLFYNPESDTYYCPAGQAMNYIGTIENKTKTGYTQTIKQYQATNCKGCPLRVRCHKAKENRIIQRNENLIRHKQKVKQLLCSEKGIQQRKQRPWDVEGVFANIKHNMNFRRFNLRSLEKTTVEIGRVAMAHNLKKLAKAS